MNVYVISPRVHDAMLVVNRLTDQDVSNWNEDEEKPVFKLIKDGCQIDETGAWRSIFASCQRMEKMETEDLPDFDDSSNDNDDDGSTAKKIRLSSNSTPQLSTTVEPCTSQIYSGDFEKTNTNVMSPAKRSIHLNIFMISGGTKISEMLHKLFVTTDAIYIFVVNTDLVNDKDYKDTFIRMLDSIWAYTTDSDIRFPKIIIAASTLTKEFSADAHANSSSIVKEWIAEKPYEYQCKEIPLAEAVISPFLKHDQTKLLKRRIFEVLQKLQLLSQPANDSVTEAVDRFQKHNYKIVERRKVDLTENCLGEMHAKRLIIYCHRLHSKLIVFDPELLVQSFFKIIQNTENSNNQMIFSSESDLKRLLGLEYANVLLEIMFHLGFLAKAVHNAGIQNVFIVSNLLEVPQVLHSLKYLPDQKETPHTHSPILCLQFKNQHHVASAFSMIICSLLQLYPYDKQGSRALIYRDFAAFKVTEGIHQRQRLSIFYENKHMFAFILRYTKTKEDFEPSLCVKIRQVIENAISEVIYPDLVDKNSDVQCLYTTQPKEFEYLIRCPNTTSKEINEEGLIYVSHLESIEIYECSNHSDKAHPHEVDALKLLQVWLPEKVKDISDTGGTPKTSTALVAQRDRSSTKIDPMLASKIARCIGQRWQLLAFELGIDHPTLDKIIEDNPRNTDKAITDMLMQCTKQRQGNLTLKEVRKGIEETNVNVNWDEFNKL